MNKLLYRAAFCVGLVAIGWVGAGYLRSQPLALAMVALVAAFYIMGALELQRFDRDTAALHAALQRLTEPVAPLGDWLATLPASLHTAVRLRIEGERVALPGPAMTPYLAGLLVLLGMLGTFLGMVITLSGTGVALERATDLQTMRDSLAAPVKGLGLAFGTSVAGVTASAMLGLMSALCRRARLQAAQLLDTRIAGPLRAFTRAHQREQAWQLAQQQATLVPALVAQLQTMMAQMAAQAQQSNELLRSQAQQSNEHLLTHTRQSNERLLAQAQQSSEQLLASQDRFQAQAAASYLGLAESVGQSLQHAQAESTRVATTTIQTVVQATMGGIARETTALHGQVASAVQQQVDSLGLAFEQRSAALVDALAQAHAAQASHIASAMSTQLDSITTRLDSTVQQLSTTLAARDEQRLAAWAEAPRAATALVAQMHEKLSDSTARDTAMLAERTQLMATLGTLLDAVQHSTTAQRAAIDQMIESTATWLQQAGARFTEQVDAESQRMASLAAQLGDSAVDVASLGEAFGHAVELFSQSSQQLTTHLQRVDETLGRSITRSDEQLAYYVAQAREVIDLSIMSQKQIVEDLQRLADRRSAQVAPA